MTNRKKNILLVDNPIDLIALIFGIVSILVLFGLRSIYLTSSEFPSVATDSVKLIILGMIGLTGMIITRLIFHTKKGDRIPVIANTFKPNQILDFGFAIASYFGIQIIIILIRQMKIFQVTSVDVYLFFLSAAEIEELLYRGFLVMFVQIALVIIFKMKVKNESELLLVNIFTCFISGLVFALVHTGYWGDPFLMILTFLGGISQAIWYIKSKNLFVPMVAHAAINLVASGSLLQTLNPEAIPMASSSLLQILNSGIILLQTLNLGII